MGTLKEFIEKEFEEIGPAYVEVFTGLMDKSMSIKEARLRNKATDKRLKFLKQKIREVIDNSSKEQEK